MHFRSLVLAAAMVRPESATRAASPIEATVLPVLNGDREYRSCGKYFMPQKLKNGSNGGIGFTVNWKVAPSTILTALERVTVIVDNQKTVPWASVEMDTGMLNTVIRISSTELAKSPCLGNAKRQ